MGAFERARRQPWLRGALGLLAALAALALVAAALTRAEPAVVSGEVFQDTNENGVRDAQEPGVAGVSVSDGQASVQTDAQGRYSLELDSERRLTDLVFATLPDGYVFPSDAGQTPAFYRILADLQPGEQRSADFALLPRPQSTAPEFSFINLADVHVQAGTTNNRERFSEQIRQLNALGGALAFAVIAGDLTNDATDAEFVDYLASTATSRLQVWPAVGNHEFSEGDEEPYAARIDGYRRHVGPEWYSFNYGGKHFVVLENHLGFGEPEQLHWLEQDLERHARGRPVVVLGHRPLNTPQLPEAVAQTREYLELLGRYDTALVMMGHTHVNDVALDVIPGARHLITNSSSYTIDQTPNGFRLIHFKSEGGRTQLETPFVMYGVERALTIVSPGPGEVLPDAELPLLVNAYHTSSRLAAVEARVDDGPWLALRRSSAFSWAGSAPRTSPGSRRIEVRATDDAGVSWDRSGEFAVSGASLTPPRAGADWPLFHGNAQHTGAAADALPPELRLAWSHLTPGSILSSSPAIADGVVYIGTRDEDGVEHNGVHAVELTSGRQLWTFATPAQVHASPAAADGLVYASTVRGTLYALDARTGEVRWERAVGADEVGRGWMYFSPTVADGVVYQAYTTTSGGGVLALDARSGAERWDSRPDRFSNNWISEGSAVVGDGIVYAVANNGRIFALDRESGELRWQRNPRGGWVHSTPAIAGGRLYASFQGGHVVALDAASGEELWSYRSTDPSYVAGDAAGSSPAVAGDAVYVGFHDGNVTALDAASGAVRWSYRTGSGIISSPAVSGETVFVGSNDGKLYALDRASGELRWSYEIGTWVASSPAISGTALVVGAFDGNLYAFTPR